MWAVFLKGGDYFLNSHIGGIVVARRKPEGSFKTKVERYHRR